MEKELYGGEQNLILLENLIPKNENFYSWCFSTEGECIGSSCPADVRKILEKAFHILGGFKKARHYTLNTEHKLPYIIGTSIGMQWALTVIRDRNMNRFFIIGPVFYIPVVKTQLYNSLAEELPGYSASAWMEDFITLAQNLPVISYEIFIRYIILAYSALTGQKIGFEDIQNNKSKILDTPVLSSFSHDRNRVYLAEKALLQAVRNGNLNFHQVLINSTKVSSGVPIRGKEPLRQSKTSIIVFITLVSRSAMEGGLSPEIAYPLGDLYIQSVENCRDSGELTSLSYAMYHDFILRVHELNQNPKYSYPIKKCCDYVELSIHRKITAADLASLVGYSEYYLTEKFKKETGFSLNTYIKTVKIEHAKLLLASTDLPVSRISDELAFNTPNYFIQCFKELAGCTPAQYRKKIAI